MNEGLILDNLLFTQDDFNLNLSLTVPEGAFACLLGPSGCGKTTLLRLIGGFASPAGGTITLRGRDITETEPHRRRLGIVFQDYALFPHLSVEENIAYGLKTRRGERPDKGAIRRRVEELLDLVELKGYARRRVPSLSGGEQQRIALARALAPRPDLLLLDEPLSALDVQLRASLRREIRRIQERLGVTTLYITHDQEEALTLSDRIYLMRGAAPSGRDARGDLRRPGDPLRRALPRPIEHTEGENPGTSERKDQAENRRRGSFHPRWS